MHSHASPQQDDEVDTVSQGKQLLEESSVLLKSVLGLNNLTDTMSLDPTSFFYFEYLKATDEGRVFSCVILMLVLENTKHLQTLHKSAAVVFAPDERHTEAKGKLISHLALCYAPEYKGGFLERRMKGLERMHHHHLKPLQARLCLCGVLRENQKISAELFR